MIKPIDTVKDFEIKIKVPASSANLGSGYDSFGLALNLYNHYSCRILTQNDPLLKTSLENPYPIVWEVDEELASYLSFTKDNLLLKSLLQIFKEADEKLPPIAIKIEAGIPISRGLGSSANAIVAGLILGRELLRYLYSIKISLDEIQYLAAYLEGHPDNVTPIIMGGFCFSYGSEPGEYSFNTLKTPLNLLLAVPSYTLATNKSRDLIPKSVPLKDAVFNLRASAMWLKFIETGNYTFLKHALGDKLHQTYRSEIITEFPLINELLLSANQPGAVLSGAGPSILIFLSPESDSEIYKTKIQELYTEMKKKANIIEVSVDNIGVRIL